MYFLKLWCDSKVPLKWQYHKYLLILNLCSVFQDILVSVENTVMYRMDAVSLCSNQPFHLELRVNRNNLELFTPLKKDTISSENLQRQLAILDEAMKGTVTTYLGGLPGSFILFSFSFFFQNFPWKALKSIFLIKLILF